MRRWSGTEPPPQSFRRQFSAIHVRPSGRLAPPRSPQHDHDQSQHSAVHRGYGGSVLCGSHRGSLQPTLAHDCPEVFGDSLEQVLGWNATSDVSKLLGEPIRMRIILKDADVYGSRFRR